MTRKRSKATCYMCPRRATSREHVPPAAFFPEAKDSPGGTDFRRNLITVPSCPEDNTAKSGDDQYLAIVIASSIQTNQVAQILMTPKTRRALNYRSGIRGFFNRLSPIQIGPIETGVFEVDRSRLNRAADQYARGLYYNEFQAKLTGPLSIHTSSLFLISGTNPEESNMQLRSLTELVSRAVETAPRVGHNPDIFYYQIVRDNKDRVIMRMVFYDGFIIDAYSPSISGNGQGDA